MASRERLTKGLKYAAKLRGEPPKQLIEDILDIVYTHAIFNEEYTTQLIVERLDKEGYFDGE